VSIDDGRSTGGNAGSGYFTPSEQRYPGYDPGEAPSDLGSDVEETPREPHRWHFGADLGLFILRITLGALVLGHGLQKVFSLMQGQGIAEFARNLAGLGFEQTTALAWTVGITELVAGGLLILGLFTPAAAAAVLAVTASAIWVKVDVNLFAGAVELEALYAAAAAALLFTGAGKISLDRNTPWFRRAPAFGFVFLLLAAGLSVAVLLVLR
jgi:putative oxidoreductase